MNDSIEKGIQFFKDDSQGKELSYVDIHCHCLFGVDDGPRSMAESIYLCKLLIDNNISTVVATPHQLGLYSETNKPELIRRKVEELNEQLVEYNVDLKVLPGGDVRVDERLCELIESDKILTLADGGKYLLLELPSETFFDIESILANLLDMGIHAIISHPERNNFLRACPGILQKWLQYSISIQITAASLLGDFGDDANVFSWKMLTSGYPCVVATDAHNLIGRKPRMDAAFKRIKLRCGEETAMLVCIENPRRIIEGYEVVKVESRKIMAENI